MLFRTEGIVLKTQKYGDADLIVTYFTLERGALKAFAKSPRKIKSRFGSSLEPFTHAKIALFGKEQTSLPKLTQSDIIHSFQGLRDDLDNFISVSKHVELIITMMHEAEPNKKIFSLFLNTSNIIEKTRDRIKRDAISLIFQIRLLDILGYRPRLGSCGRCGRKKGNFYISHGTALCEKCGSKMEKSLELSQGAISFYAHASTWPISNILRLTPSSQLLSQLSSAIDEHITYLLSKKLKTSIFQSLLLKSEKNLSSAFS